MTSFNPEFNKDGITIAFRRECSTRRAANVLQIKRQRIRDDLRQMLGHISLVVPKMGNGEDSSEVLNDALSRLGDDAFAELVRTVLEDG